MSRRTLVCTLLLVLQAATTSMADDTWYSIREQYDAENSLSAQRPEQVEEIEIAPGASVRADIWEDDYVPTYEEMVEVGFLPEEADIIARDSITWGRIKACFGKPDPIKCLAEKNNG